VWIPIALSFFLAHPTDDQIVATTDSSGAVRVSFDGGERWMAATHCHAPPRLRWRDADLVVDCAGASRRFDGAEMFAHWRLLAPPSLPGGIVPRRLSQPRRRRRLRWRRWLPRVEVTVRAAWSRNGGERAVASRWLVALRWDWPGAAAPGAGLAVR